MGLVSIWTSPQIQREQIGFPTDHYILNKNFYVTASERFLEKIGYVCVKEYI